VTTPREFSPPRSFPSAGWVAELSAALDDRREIVAAYYVTARYLEPPSPVQEELHLELREPPGEGGAPPQLFREFANDVLPATREGVIFTFPTTAILPRVREAATVLWTPSADR